MHQFLARAAGRDVEQLHRILSWRIFIIIGEGEQLRQLRRLMQELIADSRQAAPERLSGKQYERFHLRGMLTRKFDAIPDAEPSCSSRADDTAVHAWL